MVNISANIARKYTSIIRAQLPTPIHLHQHIKTTFLLTSSCNHTHNITFLSLLLKKEGRASQKMAKLKSVTVYQFDIFNLFDFCYQFDLFSPYRPCRFNGLLKYPHFLHYVKPQFIRRISRSSQGSVVCTQKTMP